MDGRIRRIADYLLACRDAAQFDPVGLGPALLPHAFILAIERPPDAALRLRIQLAGSALETALDQPLKGRCMEDFMHGPFGAEVLRGFHDCAAGDALWMRQVASIGGRLPRFVEGVAVFLAPDRIYGGLVIGEIVGSAPGSNFARRPLR